MNLLIYIFPTSTPQFSTKLNAHHNDAECSIILNTEGHQRIHMNLNFGKGYGKKVALLIDTSLRETFSSSVMTLTLGELSD